MWKSIRNYLDHWNSDPVLDEAIRRNREALERKRKEFRLSQQEGESSHPIEPVKSDAA